jgi:hypothetical protein
VRKRIKLVPEPMPEEASKGYGGRLVRWNDLAGRAELRSIAQESVPGDQSSPVKEIVLLARLVEKETERFVRDHTVLPYTQSFEGERAGQVVFGDKRSLERTGNAGLRLARRHAHYCPRCLAEDLPFHGFTYWRREPQLSGRTWCFKHFCPLRKIPNADIFSVAPSMAAAAAVDLDNKWVDKLMRSPILNRFYAIQDGLLSLKAPLRQSPVSRMIRDRATACSFHGGRGKVRARLISEHLRRVIDMEWLADVFPGVDQARGGYFAPIDAAARGHHHSCSPSGYAIVAALLWEDADEALNAILDAERHDVLRDARPKSQPLADVSALRNAYIEAEGNHVEVARRLALPQSSVASSLKALGLPALGQPDRRVLAAANDFCNRRSSLEQAATAHQIDLCDLEDFIRRSMADAGSAIERRLLAGSAAAVRPKTAQAAAPSPMSDQKVSQNCSPGLRSSKRSKRSGERLSNA